MSALMPKPGGYHHGDLRQVLLEAALEQIAAQGVAKLSLRSLAREAGVTATAPYRHFDSKRGLLAALAQRGFEELGARMAAALIRSQPLEARLLALGETYIDFATANPTTYHLMFGSVIDDFSEYEALQTAADESFAILSDLLQEVLDSGGGNGLDLDVLGGVTWSAMHGIASLVISGITADLYRHRPLPPTGSGPVRSVDALRRNSSAALATLLRGILQPVG